MESDRTLFYSGVQQFRDINQCMHESIVMIRNDAGKRFLLARDRHRRRASKIAPALG
jgi:hypothetical protein